MAYCVVIKKEWFLTPSSSSAQEKRVQFVLFLYHISAESYGLMDRPHLVW
jgi:hypothetical protein